MHATEIVVRDEQRDCRFVILPLLAMAVRQSREAANLHSQREVASLDVARANADGFRFAHDRGFDDANNLRRRVSTRAFFVWLAIHLNQGSEVNAAPAKDGRDDAAIRREAVRGQLESASRGVIQVVREDRRIGRRALPDVECQNQFRVALKRRETPRIAQAALDVMLVNASLLFAVHESPDFVTLNVGDGDVTNRLFEKLFATLARVHHRRNDRVAMDAHETLNGADRIAFK